MPRGSEIPEGIRSRAVDLHKAGKGYKFISKTLEIPPSTVRSIIMKWKRFNTVATLPRSGRPTKGNPRRKRNEKLDEADFAGPASDKDGAPDKPKHMSKVRGKAGNADSNSLDTEPSKDDRVSSGTTLHSGDKEMRDFNNSFEEGDNTGQSNSGEQDLMSSFLFARSTGEAEDHERDSVLQKQWAVKIRRDHFIVTNTSRVCSRHFVTADLIEPPTPAGRRRLQPGAVPVLFHWNNYNIPTPRLGVWGRTERPPNTDLTVKQTDPDEDDPGSCHEHDYCASTEPAALHLSLNENKELREEISKLRKQIEDLTVSSKFCLERFSASDEDIRFFTRFASHAHLMGFWKQIEPATLNIIRVTRTQSVTKTDQVPHSASATVLQPIDEFFLFMNYLSLGLMQKDLAHRFRIHQSTVSHIVNTWAHFLYTVLGAVNIWLDEDTVKAHLPEVFQDYADTQVILDCTELQCQTPNSLLQSEVFSTYKSHCTFKGLIGIAPHGAVTFVSSLYQGATSDKEILKQSGIVALLKPSMAIMVDKGFLVEDCVPGKVHILTFLSNRAQLSRSEIRKTQAIARLRVHVERVIHRVKEHKIFSTVIPLSITGSINQLFAVACLLVNYQNGPLVKAWASNC